MKKLIAFLLVFSLFLALTSVALAAGPKITRQPESGTTDEKGSVSFSLKVSGAKGITWRFVNPATGEETTGKKLNTVFRKIKVSGPNSATITLKNVPEEMHGWYVYCHITGNGYEVDSDRVRLLVAGLPAPDDGGTPAETVPEGPPDNSPAGADVEVISVTSPEASDPRPAEVSAQPETHPDENGNLVEGPAETARVITVHAKDATLYPVDAYNNPIEEEASAELTFEGSGSVAVRAGGDVRYWVVNGIRIDPENPVSSFLLRDITADLAITAVLSGSPARNVDESKMVTVTCEGCKFTWNKGGLKNVTSGQVPAGTEILVMADAEPVSGFSVNGGPFDDGGKYSVRRTVTEDTVIKAE